jgi:hypothetical protein
MASGALAHAPARGHALIIVETSENTQCGSLEYLLPGNLLTGFTGIIRFLERSVSAVGRNSFLCPYKTLVWIAYLLCFILLCHLLRQPRLLRASLLVLAATIWIVSIINMIEFWGSNAVKLRYLLGLGEPTAVVVPLFAALALHVRRRREAFLCGLTAVLAWLTTLQALQRAPLLSASMALVMMTLAMVGSSKFRPRNTRRPIMLLAAFIFIILLQSIPSQLMQDQPSSIERIKLSGATDLNIAMRLLYWTTDWRCCRHIRFTGVGAGNTKLPLHQHAV